MLNRQTFSQGANMPYDGRAVANALLDIADERGIGLTHLALQKLCFYAHGWHLVQFGKPLVQQSFEAWEHGPVLRQVWETLRTPKDKAVTRRATRFDHIAQTREVVSPTISSDDRQFLEAIVSAYGHIAGAELSDMTHARGGPWDRVWNAPNGRVNLGMRISNEMIRDHFLTVTRRAAAT